MIEYIRIPIEINGSRAYPCSCVTPEEFVNDCWRDWGDSDCPACDGRGFHHAPWFIVDVRRGMPIRVIGPFDSGLAAESWGDKNLPESFDWYKLQSEKPSE